MRKIGAAGADDSCNWPGTKIVMRRHDQLLAADALKNIIPRRPAIAYIDDFDHRVTISGGRFNTHEEIIARHAPYRLAQWSRRIVGQALHSASSRRRPLCAVRRRFSIEDVAVLSRHTIFGPEMTRSR